MKKHIITITGKPGSGKSSTGALLAKRLGYDQFSSGSLMRQLAIERGNDIVSANKAGEKDRTLDDIVDARQKELGQTRDKFVIDGRMGWMMIPDSFKVYLKLDIETAARRILADQQNTVRRSSEHLPDDPVEYAKEMMRRLESEKRRYRQYYNADPFNESNYDLVVDTAIHSLNEVVDIIEHEYKQWIAG